MAFSETVLKLAPVLIAAAVAYFIKVSNRRQRLAVLFTWLFPGAGHFWLGHKTRGRFVAACIVPMFLTGLVLAGFLNVSPMDRHPVWGLAQAPGGLLTLVAWLATLSLKVTSANDYYLVGSLYTGSACLLNLVVMCDVWDLAGQAKEPADAAPAAAAAAAPAAGEEPA